MARIDRPTADPATGRPKGGCDRRSHVPLAVPYRDGGRRQATPGCLPMTARCASATNLVAPVQRASFRPDWRGTREHWCWDSAPCCAACWPCHGS